MTEQILISLFVIAVGGWIVCMNWYRLFAGLWTMRNHPVIPLFGALFLFLGLWLNPITRPDAWIAFLIDYGTLLLPIVIPLFLFELWKTSGVNRLAHYSRKQNGLQVDVTLYRRNTYLIVFRVNNQVESFSGPWSLHDRTLSLASGDRRYDWSVAEIEGRNQLTLVSAIPEFQAQAGMELIEQFRRPSFHLVSPNQ